LKLSFSGRPPVSHRQAKEKGQAVVLKKEKKGSDNRTLL